MDSNENILKAHDWLREFKKYKRLSNKEIGSCINYSDTGILKALKNNTLGLEQIQVIAKKYDALNELNTKLDAFKVVKKMSPDDLRGINARIDLQDEKIKSLTERFKMLYQQLLFFQNQTLDEKSNSKSESS